MIDINEQAGDKKYAAIHYAAKNKNSALYKLLEENGANVNLQDSGGYTALILKENHT